jgi:CIC family chloride channel protein
MVGGVTGAAITAIVMIFEMTLDYNVILPITITVAISYGVRKFLCKESIYTLKLARRGHHMPEAMQANFHFLRLARDLMEPALMTVAASTPIANLGQIILRLDHQPYLLVEEGERLLGVVEREPVVQVLARHGIGVQMGELAIRDFEVVTEGTTLFELLSQLRSKPTRIFLVAARKAPVSAREIQGVISKERIADSMTESLGLFCE